MLTFVSFLIGCLNTVSVGETAVKVLMFDSSFSYRVKWLKEKSAANIMWLRFLCPFPHYSASGDAHVFYFDPLSIGSGRASLAPSVIYCGFSRLLCLAVSMLPGCRQCSRGEDVKGIHGIPMRYLKHGCISRVILCILFCVEFGDRRDCVWQAGGVHVAWL